MMSDAPAPETKPDLHGKTVWALDTLSRVYQLFHALPEMTAPDGTPVSVVFGLTRDLLDIVEKKKPDYLFCAMDPPGPTFRHEMFEAYKANRAEMPADLVPQIPLVRRLFEVFGIPCLEVPGYEADDVLATLATQTVAGGGDCTIATSDKDARQLLGPHVRLLNLRTNQPLGVDELMAEWGIGPGQVVDFLSLVGDSVDNVPGVPGIGPKIAAELLQKHGTLDTLLANIDAVSGAKRKENLAAHGDTARTGRRLIMLERAVPLTIPWASGALHAPDSAALADLLRTFGFRSLLDRVVRGGGGHAAAAEPSAQVAVAKAPVVRTLFDMEAAEPEAAVRPAPRPIVVEEPRSPQEIAAVVARLRAAGPLTLCVVRPTGGTILARPVGAAVAAGDACGWFAAETLASNADVRELLADASLPKRGHDLKRQDVALRSLGIRLAGASFDTLLAAYLLEAGERNLGLTETAIRHGVAVADPTAAAEVDHPLEPRQAAAHCRLVQELAVRLPPLLENQGLAQLFATVEMPLAAVLAGMEVRGVRIDSAALAALSAAYAIRLEELEREIHALAGHSFAIASPLQLRVVLFDELGLPVVKRGKTGPSTDAEVLEQLAPLHPLPAKLLEHRKYAKLKSTYVDALPALVDPSTGRIHTSFNQTVTATGRLSSSDPNLQNIPTRTAEGQQIRAAFLPGDAGWRFVAADYSQIELRVLAHLSGDAAMKAAFAAGEDIHTRTAAGVHGIDAASVTSAMRRVAKAVNFGILYGQSAFGLARALGIPQADAAEFIAGYFRVFEGAAAFMDDVLDRCRRDGSVTTMLGRRRRIAGVRDRTKRRNAAGVMALTLPEREAVNTVVQGSAADLIKLAMLRVDGRLRREGRRSALVLQIHDELLLEAPADEVADIERLVVEEMQSAMTLSVPIEVSVQAGGTWAECE
ncbi:MAG: DNA polymerase I [Planctomycetia bacterium]|nr:DNA polymerase I [Planctomycetia bacterium]